MSPPNVSSLLLNHPRPLSALKLGRLVLDPLYPDDEFYPPDTPENPDQIGLVNNQPSASPVFLNAKVEKIRIDDFKATLDRSKGTKLELNLLKILSLAWQAADCKTKTTVDAPVCLLHELQNPQTYFKAACQDEGVREWIEEQVQRRGTRIYLICAFKTMTNARVKQTIEQKTNVDASFAVPAAAIAAAAGIPLPIPLDSGMDVGAGLKLKGEAGEDSSYTVKEELVYAVQYRKIQFEWFSSGKVDKSYLERGEKGRRWMSYIGDRSDETGEEKDAIDVEVADPLGVDDFVGTFESFNLDGEEILYEVDEDEEVEKQELQE
jgi:hypothetical protein